jgi:hypothetical protein
MMLDVDGLNEIPSIIAMPSRMVKSRVRAILSTPSDDNLSGRGIDAGRLVAGYGCP